MRGQIDRCMEEMDNAMTNLRGAMQGIPYRRGGFKKNHDNLARDVAALAVLLDSSRTLQKQQ